MKTLLIMLLVGICMIGWRSPVLAQLIGIAEPVQNPAALTIDSLTTATPDAAQRPISAEEFARMSRSDPNAYQKFIGSYQPQERTEVDKLLNFLALGAYE